MRAAAASRRPALGRSSRPVLLSAVGLLTLALALALTTATPALSADDTTPPVLTSLSRAGTGPYAPGSQVAFNYSATDASGVARIAIDVADDTGDTHAISGDGASGVARGTITSSWAPGPAVVEYVEVEDLAGNISLYGADGSVTYFPNPSGPTTHSFDFAALGFEVSAGSGDTAPPVISEFDFTPKSVDVTAGARQVTVTARVTDATGANAPTATLSSGVGAETLGGSMTRTSGTVTDGVYSLTVSVPTTATPGDWTVRISALSDTVGNTESAAHVHPSKLTVTGATADTAAPVLSEFDFAPKSVDVGTGVKAVTVTARVTDATGATAPTLVLDSDTTTQTLGAGPMTRTSGDAKSGLYEKVVSIPSTAATGAWTVRIDPLSDAVGNTETGPHDHATKLTVSRTTTTDSAAPVLSAFDFTPKSVDVTAGSKDITVTARITDATGANTPMLHVDSDSTTQVLGNGPMTRTSGDAKDGVYTRTVTVPTTAAPGDWTVVVGPLSDSLGNTEVTSHAHGSRLAVTSSGLDDAAPTLSDFAFTPTSVDVTAGAKSVTISARVADDTGAETPTLVLDSDTTTQTLGAGPMTRTSGDAKNGVYSRTVTIPATAAPGSWSVVVNPLADTLGNTEAAAHTHPTRLTVTSAEADDAAPQLSEFDFTPKSADLGTGSKEVTVTARITDATGAETPTLVLDSDTTTQTLGAGPMTRTSGDAKNGVYSRTVTIPATAPPGSWSVVVNPLVDVLGNTGSAAHTHPTKLTVVGTSTGMPPNAPTGVTAVPGNRSAQVSWTAPADNDAPITAYTVTVGPGGRTIPVDAGRTSVRVTGLTNGTPYTFTVAASNEHGSSATSAPSSPVTPAAAPGRVALPRVVVRDGRVILRWTAPSTGGARITGYRVFVNGRPSDVPATPTRLVARTLKPGRYQVKIAATNRVGTGRPSPVLRFRVPR